MNEWPYIHKHYKFVSKNCQNKRVHSNNDIITKWGPIVGLQVLKSLECLKKKECCYLLYSLTRKMSYVANGVSMILIPMTCASFDARH
jgi:hypothetical protein